MGTWAFSVNPEKCAKKEEAMSKSNKLKKKQENELKDKVKQRKKLICKLILIGMTFILTIISSISCFLTGDQYRWMPIVSMIFLGIPGSFLFIFGKQRWSYNYETAKAKVLGNPQDVAFIFICLTIAVDFIVLIF